MKIEELDKAQAAVDRWIAMRKQIAMLDAYNTAGGMMAKVTIDWNPGSDRMDAMTLDLTGRDASEAIAMVRTVLQSNEAAILVKLCEMGLVVDE